MSDVLSISCLALAALLLGPAARVEAGVWVGNEEPVSGDGRLSRTTPSNRYVGQLPDQSLFAVWYTRTGPRTSQIHGGHRDQNGHWVAEPGSISVGDSLARLPTLAVGPSGELHVVWIDNRDGNEEIYYRGRAADGAWGPEERLTTTPESSLSPVVAAAANGWVHVAWSDGGSGRLSLVVRSRPPGGEWGAPVALTEGVGYSENPSMQVDAAGEVHLVWQDTIIDPIPNVDDPDNVEIYYIRLNSEGSPETQPFRISTGLGRSQRPSIAAEPNGTLHVFWCDNRNHGPHGAGFPIAIWYRRSLPGLGFGHEKRFIYSAGDRLNPAAAVDASGTVNVVYEDYSTGNGDIYYRQITPAGGWDPFSTRLTATAGASQGAAILAEPTGKLHLLWSDLRGADDLNVYYRQGWVDASTPVVLAAFEVTTTPGAVDLRWRTSSEIDHAGFEVYGAPASDAEGTLLAPLQPASADGSYYARFAADVAPPGSTLKLVSVSRAGLRRVEAERTVPEPPGIPELGLLCATPNPSSAAVMIPLAPPAAGPVDISIVDVTGRVVRRIAVDFAFVETLGLGWDGRDDAGQRVVAGLYYVRASQAGRPFGRKLTLIRLP